MADANTGTSGTLRVTAYISNQSVSEQWWDITWSLQLLERVSSPTWSGIARDASVSIEGVGAVWAGTFTFDWRPAGLQSQTIASGTTRVYAPPSGSGAGLGDVTGAIAYTGTSGAGGPTSVTQSVTPPTLIAAPDAPTIGTVTRVSDTALTVPWTPNPAAGKPYDGQSVWVSVDGAAYTFVANVGGAVASYSFTAAANHKYTFLVNASNSAGSTASSASNVIITTPATLASLPAALVTSGTIRLTLPVRPTPFTEAQVVITETHNGGATWNAKTTLAMSALSASTTTTWDDTSAQTGGTVQYKAVVQTTGGTQGTLSSVDKLSNTLVLNTPPNAPTGLTPSGSIDASRTQRLGWTHNASSDGAAQSSRKIEYSTDGGATSTSIVAGDSTLGYYDWTPTLGDFTAGETITYRVATAGSQPGTYGAWSNWQSITLHGGLSVTLTVDNPPATHVGGPIPVAWTSSATWGTASQIRRRITMTDQATGLVVYDTGLAPGTDESGSIPATVQVDGHVYTVAVTLLDNHQIESVPATRSVTTDYLAPGPVDLTWAYDDEAGSLTFYPTFSEETSSAFDDTARWSLERSLDGETWVSVGAVTGELPINDDLVRLGVDSYYRTTSFTELDVASEPTVWTVPAADVMSRWGWLNYGPLFQSRVRFGWGQTVDISTGRAAADFEVEGVDYSVAIFGQPLSAEYAVSGKLLYGDAMPASLASATAAEMMALSLSAAVCVFRDAEGMWFTSRAIGMKVSPLRKTSGPAEAGVSFTIKRITG